VIGSPVDDLTRNGVLYAARVASSSRSAEIKPCFLDPFSYASRSSSRSLRTPLSLDRAARCLPSIDLSLRAVSRHPCRVHVRVASLASRTRGVVPSRRVALRRVASDGSRLSCTSWCRRVRRYLACMSRCRRVVYRHVRRCQRARTWRGAVASDGAACTWRGARCVALSAASDGAAYARGDSAVVVRRAPSRRVRWCRVTSLFP
jgi:hypothetical protein